MFNLKKKFQLYLLNRTMENWTNELEKAYLKGFKNGVTKGYSNGSKDARATGYFTAIHDLLDIIEDHPEGIASTTLIDKMREARLMREACDVFIHSTSIKNDNPDKR